jgi:hypothetical protein
MSTDITFCVSKSCESAAIENAPISTSTAIASTEKRLRGIEFPPGICGTMKSASYRLHPTQVNQGSAPKECEEDSRHPLNLICGSRLERKSDIPCAGFHEVVHSQSGFPVNSCLKSI